MKTNKKAILGMLVAMLMSLGVMNGINNQSTVKEANLCFAAMQAYGGGCMTSSESFAAGAFGAVMSSMTGAIYGAAFGGPVGFAVGLGVGL